MGAGSMIRPRSVGAMVSPQADRATQARAMPPEEIHAILDTIRRTRALPQLDYHFERHGREFRVSTSEEYLQALRQHLLRDDLRVFTYIRTRGQVPIWALVAPDNAHTVLYNELRRVIWSFYRPQIPALRMRNVQSRWIELVREGDRWIVKEDWQWAQ